MSRWIRYSGGRLTYAGAVSRGPFAAWADTPAGRAVVGSAAERVRFSLFGKERAARKRMWREIAEAGSDGSVIAAVQREADGYVRRLGKLAYGEGLPRVTVNLRRLVILPRQLLNGTAYRSMAATLSALPAVASIDSEPLRDFFFRTLVDEMDVAIVGTRPTPKRPLACGDEWASIGVEGAFVWYVPFEGPTWTGHHYMFEMPREAVTRALRKAIEANIKSLEAWLPSLSRVDRNDILRRAWPAK